MTKVFSNLLTFWIPSRKLRRKYRSKLINFQPVKEYLQRTKIKRYLKQKAQRGRAKVVVYSAIAGGHDKVRTHDYLVDEFDYVIYTDQPVKGLHAWESRPMKEYQNPCPVRRAKFYKLFPDQLFPKYEYSIWIDGKWDILGPDFKSRINDQISNDHSIACMPHPIRDCIYQEAKACIEKKLDSLPLIDAQIKFFQSEKYPKNKGLYEMSLIFRKHHDPMIKKLMADWWKIIDRFSRRDQLSFVYVLWKNQFEVDKLFDQGESPAASNNADYRCWGHNK